MGKLLLHIGSEKTGSTSFQAYLELASRRFLSFDYVTGDGHPHSFLDYSLSKKLADDNVSTSLGVAHDEDYGVLGERIESIKNNPNPSVISCELFYRDPSALKAILSCCSKYSVDVSILALVRSLPKYLRSLYGEALKWGEIDPPVKWARRTQESLLSSESLSICSQFCPGQIYLWNFDRLVSEIRHMDPMLYLLEQMFVSCFGMQSFTNEQRDLLKIDSVRNPGLDPRLLAIMRESNRNFNDSRITRSLMRFLSESKLVQDALLQSCGNESARNAVKLEKQLKQLSRFAESVNHRHVHTLAFSGVETLFVRL